MKRVILAFALTAVSTIAYAENANDRLKEASEVVQELMNAGDKGVPQDLLESAKCAVIIPGAKKGGFFVGGQYGRGFADAFGNWNRALPHFWCRSPQFEQLR